MTSVASRIEFIQSLALNRINRYEKIEIPWWDIDENMKIASVPERTIIISPSSDDLVEDNLKPIHLNQKLNHCLTIMTFGDILVDF